jgi:hypothetical protein
VGNVEFQQADAKLERRTMTPSTRLCLLYAPLALIRGAPAETFARCGRAAPRRWTFRTAASVVQTLKRAFGISRHIHDRLYAADEIRRASSSRVCQYPPKHILFTSARPRRGAPGVQSSRLVARKPTRNPQMERHHHGRKSQAGYTLSERQR